MANTVRDDFENGDFRPLGPVDLPEGCEVKFEPQMIVPAPDSPNWDELYAILGKSIHTGEADLAERHNENQP